MPLRETPDRLVAFVLALVVALWPGDVPANDANAWGGLFRTRDAGGAWLPVNPGSFVSGALALAVSPVDPHHVLLATDTGVLRSRNGGRDWVIEARDLLVGPAFAAAFDVQGGRGGRPDQEVASLDHPVTSTVSRAQDPGVRCQQDMMRIDRTDRERERTAYEAPGIDGQPCATGVARSEEPTPRVGVVRRYVARPESHD